MIMASKGTPSALRNGGLGYVIVLLALCGLILYEFGGMVSTSQSDGLWSNLMISARTHNGVQHDNATTNNTGTPDNKTPKDTDVTETPDGTTVNINERSSIKNTDLSTTTPDPCLARRYEITKSCNISVSEAALMGDMANFEDLASVLYVDDIASELMVKCTNGTWCLDSGADRVLYQRLGENYLTFCDLGTCLLQMPDECMTPERRLILSTLLLLCEASRQKVSGVCILALQKMSHITITNLYRKQDSPQTKDLCETSERKNCTGNCYQLSHQLKCMSTACGSKTSLLGQYEPWQWFFTMKDAETKCELNKTQCSSFTKPDEYLLDFSPSFLEYLSNMDAKVLAGLVTAVLITCAGIAVAVFACVNKLRKNIYSRQDVQYTEVKEIEVDFDPDIDAEEWSPS